MKYTIHKYNTTPYTSGSITCCMIACNESLYLERCFNSIKNLCNEFILVDTGSTDDTIILARKLGFKIYHYDWNNDFSAPRNYSISKAKSEWILIIDPDEVISKKDHFKIKHLISQNKVLAFQMITRNYTQNTRETGFIFNKKDYTIGANYPGYIESTKTRLFKNGHGIHFRGCWHELLDYYIFEKKIPAMLSTIPIHHWAHETGSKSPEEKRRFYLKLAEKKVENNPEDYQAWWELGVAESICGLNNRAAYSMSMSFKSGILDRNRLFTYARILRVLNKHAEARNVFEKAICMIYPNLTHIPENLKTKEFLLPKVIF